MRKVLLILALMLTSGIIYAFGPQIGSLTPLRFYLKPIKPNTEHTPFPKSPVQAPDVYLEENVLTFDEAVEGCTIQLVDEEEDIVFSDFIDENQTSLTLPSYLSGTYELQIITDTYIFYCEIEL